MTGIVSVALNESRALWVPWWWRYRQAVMSEEKGVRRDARGIGALSEVCTGKGEVAAAAPETAIAFKEGVVRRREESLDIRPRNRSEDNRSTSVLRNTETG